MSELGVASRNLSNDYIYCQDGERATKKFEIGLKRKSTYLDDKVLAVALVSKRWDPHA